MEKVIKGRRRCFDMEIKILIVNVYVVLGEIYRRYYLFYYYVILRINNFFFLEWLKVII